MSKPFFLGYLSSALKNKIKIYNKKMECFFFHVKVLNIRFIKKKIGKKKGPQNLKPLEY